MGAIVGTVSRNARRVRLGRRMTRQDLEQRVTRVAEAVLAEKRFVSAIDVLVGLGWLAPSHLDTWRQGRVEALEQVVQANLAKSAAAMAAFEQGRRTAGSIRRKPITLPAPATAPSCGSAPVRMLPLSGRTVPIGCLRTYLGMRSNGRAAHPISSSSRRSESGHARRVVGPATCCLWRTQARGAWTAPT